MNNPFICDCTVDNKRCEGIASQVYRSAHVTRLVCDNCAVRYRREHNGPLQVPLAEFAQLELIPAREALRDEIKRQARRHLETVAQLQRQLEMAVAGGASAADMAKALDKKVLELEATIALMRDAALPRVECSSGWDLDKHLRPTLREAVLDLAAAAVGFLTDKITTWRKA